MKRLTYAILLCLAAVAGLSFAVRNPQTVEIQYYFGWHWQAPLALVLLAAILAGFLAGYVVSSLRSIRRRREAVRKARSDMVPAP